MLLESPVFDSGLGRPSRGCLWPFAFFGAAPSPAGLGASREVCMLLRALNLSHFRNIRSVSLVPHERFNIFAGANGQGKTNVLEAIYLLSAVKSFRAPNNKALIDFNSPAATATLEALVDRGGAERVVRIDVSERGKRVFLNNNPVRQLGDFFGSLNVVMFGPEDISLLKGSPGARRKFIDRAIFNAQPAYATESSHYEEILKQRNALLKGPRFDANLLSVYDEQLIQYGADILVRRLDFLSHFTPVLERIFGSIFDKGFEAKLRYEVPWTQEPLPSLEDPAHRIILETMLAQALADTLDESRDRGHTLVGPHRDDLVASLNGQDVKTYASQGQHRAFVLAMKIAQIVYLEERYLFAPILLLDDVSSELDRARNRFLFDFLRARPEGQVFITTTHRDHILLDDDVRVFDVSDGDVVARDDAPAPTPEEE